MSVTVKELLKLPSLTNATVIAGRNGLDKVVSSVSVLETMEYELIDDHAYPNDEFNGSEIVITGFMNGADDVEAQYNSVKRLAMSGEAGLIIYYVGVVVKQIDPSIIKLADELNFPLICMPEKQFNLRYGEAISDIMGLVIRDQISGEAMIITLLEAISKLPVHQQNVGTMIRLISNRLRSSVILMTDRNHTLYEAAWPSELAGIHEKVERLDQGILKKNPSTFPDMKDTLMYREDIWASGTRYVLHIIHVGGQLPDILRQQTVEAVRIAIKLWGKNNRESLASEIVEAILTDQPVKMRTLSSMFHLNIDAVDSMWIVQGENLSADHVRRITEEAKVFCSTVCADLYKGSIILFTDTIKRRADVEALRDNIEEALEQRVRMSYYTNLKNTSEVRQAYLMNYDYWRDASKIMPNRGFFVRGDIEFARSCRHIVDNGDESVAEYISVLDAVDKNNAGSDYVSTLCAFLLDANCNMQLTSEMMFVHKNTIKYRIKMIGDCLGFNIGSMPESEKLFKSCGIKRLLN